MLNLINIMTSIKKLEKKYWPSGLREIPDAPKILYIEGELPDEKTNTFLAVVGSRKFSQYGKEACEKLIAGLGGYPIVIVSGLAIGMDTIAHRAALRAGLKTMAIPGSGLDRQALYPSVNKGLADEILTAGGCLISELEPNERPTLYSFPRRNRLMAGLTKATLIIEAAEKSGTLITARLAMEYNRDVLVVPGPIFALNSQGSNKLMKDGAHPISSSTELLDILGFKTEPGPKASRGEKQNLNLSPAEKKIMEIVSRDTVSREELIRLSGLNISQANVLLSSMEIRGLIKESMGEIHSI